MNRRIGMVVVSLVVLMSGLAYGQADQGRNRDGGNRDRGGDRGEWRQRMEQETKTRMGVTDEEWAVLKPKIDKVQELQRQATFARMGGFGRRGPGGGDNAANAPANPVADAARELRTTLENKDASAEVIKQKLQALRDARKKAADELAAAQNELKELLSARQEAALVSQGTLE